MGSHAVLWRSAHHRGRRLLRPRGLHTVLRWRSLRCALWRPAVRLRPASLGRQRAVQHRRRSREPWHPRRPRRMILPRHGLLSFVHLSMMIEQALASEVALVLYRCHLLCEQLASVVCVTAASSAAMRLLSLVRAAVVAHVISCLTHCVMFSWTIPLPPSKMSSCEPAPWRPRRFVPDSGCARRGVCTLDEQGHNLPLWGTDLFNRTWRGRIGGSRLRCE